MTIQEQLNAIDQLFNEADDEEAIRHDVFVALKNLHMSSLSSQENYQLFLEQASLVCGGLYIPYLFWTELVKFLDSPTNSVNIILLIQNYVNSAFEEAEQNQIRPLLCLYFDRERQFNVDRIKSQIIDKAHPEVRYFLRTILNFVESKPKAITAYYEKLMLLKRYFPNFDMFNLPLAQLQEQLAKAQKTR